MPIFFGNNSDADNEIYLSFILIGSKLDFSSVAEYNHSTQHGCYPNTMKYCLKSKARLVLCVAISLIFQNEAMASASQSNWKKTILFGYGDMHANQTQTIRLYNDPDPGLENRYVGESKFQGAVLFGMAFEKEWALKNSIGSAGFEFDYLGNKAVSGTVEPMVNVSPDFDVLKYYYDVNSFVLQATAKYVQPNIFYHLGAYAQAGLGGALNSLSDYHEYPLEDSSASPMLAPFGDKITASPAFSAGIGVTYQLGQKDAYVSFGYRYFCTGRGRLTKSPIQQTSDTISLSPISYQFLVLSLTAS